MRLSKIVFAALAFASLLVSVADAQQYPTRPVKVLVTIPPGGAPDIAARLLAQRLTETMGQSFFIENRSGANGNVAAEMTAHAEPDGYTLIMAADSLITINPHVYDKMPIDDYTVWEEGGYRKEGRYSSVTASDLVRIRNGGRPTLAKWAMNADLETDPAFGLLYSNDSAIAPLRSCRLPVASAFV